MICPICAGNDIALNKIQVESYSLTECNRCGFVWLNDVVLTMDYAEYGEYLFGYNLKRVLKGLGRRWGLLLSAANNEFGTSVRSLDIGAGAGFFVRYAKDAGFDAYGVEPSGLLRDYAKSTVGVKLFSKLEEVENERFHVISLFDVIEHIHVFDLPEFMNKISSLLLPGGWLIGNTPNINSLNIKLRGNKDPVIWPPSHVSYFSARSLDIAMKMFSFETILTKTEGFVPFRKRKDVPSFVDKPKSIVQKLLALPLRMVIKLFGKLLMPTNYGYQIYFAYRKCQHE
jgi:2-polyprenyl-3-methyl-5-hydroxy-6-metoxy-1,4-benzoquinol methylase